MGFRPPQASPILLPFIPFLLPDVSNIACGHRVESSEEGAIVHRPLTFHPEGNPTLEE